MIVVFSFELAAEFHGFGFRVGPASKRANDRRMPATFSSLAGIISKMRSPKYAIHASPNTNELVSHFISSHYEVCLRVKVFTGKELSAAVHGKIPAVLGGCDHLTY